MSLDTSTIHKNLDTDVKIFGLDAQDLLFILLVSMVLNFIFSGLPFAEFIVFGIPGVLSIGLYFGKRGKSKGYLFDLFKFYLTPGHYSAAETIKIRSSLYAKSISK